MIKAGKEYCELVLKPHWGWVKKHWKGFLVFTAICTAVWYCYVFHIYMKTFVQNMFMKGRKES